MTLQTPPSGTIDITDVVEHLRTAWVDFMVAYVYGVEIGIPGMEWAALPIVSDIDKAILRLIFNAASKTPEMLAFFGNTAIRKASQAKDFTDAVKAKNALPITANPEEFADAEKKQMVAFRNFVMVTN